MPETWVRSLGQEDPPEKGMATHSSILAWRIPWTVEPGGLWSMGSNTVGHNWATKCASMRAHMHTHTHTHTHTHVWDLALNSYKFMSSGLIYHCIGLEYTIVTMLISLQQSISCSYSTSLFNRFFTIWATREVYLMSREHHTCPRG